MKTALVQELSQCERIGHEQAVPSTRKGLKPFQASPWRGLKKLQRTRNMVEVAEQVVDLRTESERLTSNQVQRGVVLVSERREANAEVYKPGRPVAGEPSLPFGASRTRSNHRSRVEMKPLCLTSQTT